MRCQHKRNNNNQCKRDAEPHSKFCWQHKPGADKNGGRPPKYDQDFIQELANKLLEWYISDDNNVFLKNFMIEQELPSDYVAVFAKRNEYFDRALKRVKDIQEMRLLEKGLTKEWDKTLVIFTLKNVSGMRDNPDEQSNIEDKLDKVVDAMMEAADN